MNFPWRWWALKPPHRVLSRIVAISAMLASVILQAGCSCSGAGPPSCDELPPVPVIAACVAPIGGFPTPSEVPVKFAASIAGVVIEAGDGLPPACSTSDGGFSGLTTGPLQASTGYWLRVADAVDASEWIVGVAVPAHALPFKPGDTVAVDFSLARPMFIPPRIHLRLSMGGKRLVSIQRAAAVDDLDLADGMVVTRGPAECGTEDGCGGSSGYGVHVSVSGDSVSVARGRAGVVGGWRLIHGGVSHRTETNKKCFDLYPGRAIMAAVREP